MKEKRDTARVPGGMVSPHAPPPPPPGAHYRRERERHKPTHHTLQKRMRPKWPPLDGAAVVVVVLYSGHAQRGKPSSLNDQQPTTKKGPEVQRPCQLTTGSSCIHIHQHCTAYYKSFLPPGNIPAHQPPWKPKPPPKPLPPPPQTPSVVACTAEPRSGPSSPTCFIKQQQLSEIADSRAQQTHLPQVDKLTIWQFHRALTDTRLHPLLLQLALPPSTAQADT